MNLIKAIRIAMKYNDWNSDAKLKFWKLPVIKHYLAWRVRRSFIKRDGGFKYEGHFIPIVKEVRYLTGMYLKDSKRWTEFYFGPRLRTSEYRATHSQSMTPVERAALLEGVEK